VQLPAVVEGVVECRRKFGKAIGLIKGQIGKHQRGTNADEEGGAGTEFEKKAIHEKGNVNGVE